MRLIDRALDAIAGTLPGSPGVPPFCTDCEGWHPPDEPCGPIRHALDVLDPERPEAPVDERKPCPVCRDRLLRHPDDSLCTTCAHRVLARQVLGMPFVPEVTP